MTHGGRWRRLRVGSIRAKSADHLGEAKNVRVEVDADLGLPSLAHAAAVMLSWASAQATSLRLIPSSSAISVRS